MKDHRDPKFILYIGIALCIIGVAGLASSNANNSSDSAIVLKQTAVKITSNANGTIVSHAGISGETALDLLKSGAEVATEPSGEGSYVVSINGVEQNDQAYWVMHVNGEASTQSASRYVSNDSDTIEWRLTN